MFYQHSRDDSIGPDDNKEVGPDDIVDADDSDMPIQNSPWYQIFWDNIVGIWGAIENTFDIMYDPYAADAQDIDNIPEKVIRDIMKDYRAEVADKFKYYDGGNQDDANCLSGYEYDVCSSNPGDGSYSDVSNTAGSQFQDLSQSQSQSQSQFIDKSRDLSQGQSQEKAVFRHITEMADAASKTIQSSKAENKQVKEESDPESEKTLNKSVSRGTINKKSIIPIINAAIRKDEADSDSESEAKILQLKDVATAIFSNLFKMKKMDIGKLFAEGDASKVYKYIASILYEQNVAIDVRDGASRGKSNEGQMKEVWGTLITDYAKSSEAICYLCGGNIVPCQPPTADGDRQGGRPEMEHKLPCAVFYARFAFIYTCFAHELTAWRAYVAKLGDTDPKYGLLKEYYINMNSSAAQFNKPLLNGMYETISGDFSASLDMSNFNTMNLDLFTNFILPAYLSEFAYSHHLCNQLKSNHDLSKDDNLNNYYIGLEAILNIHGTTCNKKAAHIDLLPACINDGICHGERKAINAGLAGNIRLRKENVKAQMLSLDVYAGAYAGVSKYTEKRMIIHTIKETIKTMQVPILPTTGQGRVTKKMTIQMNMQARIVDDKIGVITSEAHQFLKQLSADVIHEGLRARSLNSAKERVRAYLDRMEVIFGSAFDTPTNIKSQLKNAVVSPKNKLQIYANTARYYEILDAILTNINGKMTALNIEYVSNDNDKEDGAILDECTDFVGSLGGILAKYGKKIDEWRGLQHSAAEQAQAAAEAEEQVAATMEGEDDNAELVGYLENANNGEVETGEQGARKAPKTDRQGSPGFINDAAGGGRKRRQVRKTRKLKRRPRKTTKRGGRRKRSMKRKYRSRRNTRRR